MGKTPKLMKKLHEMKDGELRERLLQLQNTLMRANARFGETGRGMVFQDPMIFRNIRKEIAKIKTILRGRGVKI